MSSDGEIVWWILRTNRHGEHFYTIKLDNEDNVYCLGNYSWDDYQIGDTFVYNPPWHDIQPTSRAIVIKYNKNGEFQWLHEY